MDIFVVKQTGLTWEEAYTILKKGGFVNHAHWEHEGHPTALKVTKTRFVVTECDQVPLHTWRPTQPEFDSDQWQEIGITTVPG